MSGRHRAVVAALGIWGLLAMTATGADHLDSPRLRSTTATLGNLDINDLYLFQSPSNPANTVMIATVSPAAGAMSPTTFAPFPTGLYEFRVDSDQNGVTDRILQVAFSRANRIGRQRAFAFLFDPRTGRRFPISNGLTESTSRVLGGGLLRTGLFDDPFFFDFVAFNEFLERARAGAPLAERIEPLTTGQPSDFFEGLNVLAIVLEVPSIRLTGNDGDTSFSVWARTLLDGEQFDRTGLPAVNTAAIPTDFKDIFNLGSPLGDGGFEPLVASTINSLYGLPLDQATDVSQLLLADQMPFDASDPSGFLNGRRLEDDVIDAEFALLTGGALTTDRVDNTSDFRDQFPYLAPANP